MAADAVTAYDPHAVPDALFGLISAVVLIVFFEAVARVLYTNKHGR
jgi:hypothetical protein